MSPSPEKRGSEQVTVEVTDDEKQALRHELSEPYGHEIRIGIFEKLRNALESSHPTPDGEESESFSGFEILTAAWGDGLRWLTVKITDPEQESKVVRLVPEPDGPASPVLGDEERKLLRTVAADLDERASISRYRSEASAFRVKAEFVRRLAQGEERDA